MIITLCRRGLLKIYASFCELNISFYKTLTFRFADYKNKSPALSFKLFTGEYNCKDNHYL